MMPLFLQLQLHVRMLVLMSAAIVASTSASIGVLDPAAVEWWDGSAQANYSKSLPLAPSKLVLIREALSTDVDTIRQLLKEDPEEELASQAPPNKNPDDIGRHSERIAVDVHVGERNVARFNPLLEAKAGLSPLASASLRWYSQHQAFLANNEQARTAKPVGGGMQETRGATTASSEPKPIRNKSPDEKGCGDGDLSCELTAQPHMLITIVGAISGCCFLCCFCVCLARDWFSRKVDTKEVVVQPGTLDEMHEVWILQQWKQLAPGQEAALVDAEHAEPYSNF